MNHREVIVPTLTIFFGIIVSIVIYFLVNSWEQSETQRTFDLIAFNRLNTFHTEVIRHQEVVSSLAALISTKKDLSRAEFASFVRRTLLRFPEIKALGWNQLVKHEERQSFINKNRAEGFKNFQITEVNSRGQRVKATTRDEYVVVNYMEPMKGNEEAFGFDIASHAGRLEAIKQARDTGKPIITERIKLVQEKGNKFGYLLLKAIYHRDFLPASLDERSKQFAGVSVGVFQFSDAISTIMQDITPLGVDVWISDLSAPVDKQFLHFYSSRTREEVFHPTVQDRKLVKEGLHKQIVLDVFGRKWSFLFAPAPKFKREHSQWLAWPTAAAVMFITLLVALFLSIRAKNIDKLANMNTELQDQINEREQAERLKQISEEQYRLAMQATQDGLWDWDLSTGTVSYSPGWGHILGLATVENSFSTWEKRIHPDDKIRIIASLKNNLKKGKDIWKEEYRLLKHNNTWVWVYGRGQVIERDSQDTPLRMLGTMSDINEKKLAEEAHRNAEERFSLLLNSAAEAIYGIDTEGICTFVNKSCVEILGYDNEKQLIDQNIHNLIHHTKLDGSNCPSEQCRIYKAFLTGTGSHVADEIFWRKDGLSIPVEYWSYPMFQNGEIVGSVVTFFDITKQRNAQVVKEHLMHDMEERIKELQCMFGITESIRRHTRLDEILYDTVKLMPQGWQYPVYCCVRIILDDREFTDDSFVMTEWQMSSDLIIGNKYRGSVEVYYTKQLPEFDEGSFLNQERLLIDAIAETLSEAIEHKNDQAELEHLASHDVLTGLLNRKNLEQRINNDILRAARYNSPLSVFMIDIDHFKQINDTYGHQAGDIVLQTFSKILVESIRVTDYVARYGGEEFVIVLPETSTDKAIESGERLLINIAKNNFTLGDEKAINITASIGTSSFPEHAETWNELLAIADFAMYEAKKSGRNQLKVG